MNSKLVLPVVLGLSMVTVTAFVVYYVFKKDEDEVDGKIKTSRVNVIEVTVSKNIVPGLIGRSGSNIKEIEKKSGALIHFKKFSDKDYDVCIIRGRSDAAQLAETLVRDFINNQPLIVEDSMAVPSWSCGRIIGTGGDNIKDISHRSGARIKVEGQQVLDSTATRQISFKGTKEQILVAKDLIDKAVAQEKCRREIEQSKRSPRHSQPAAPSPAPSPAPSAASSVADASELATMPGDTHAHKHAARKSEVSAAAIEVYVSAVSSPSRFWVQFVGPQVTTLDELVDSMTQYYGDKQNREAHALDRVSVGQVVAAVFRHDGRWYRARVTALKPNEFDATQQVADVFYVDYGDSEYVATHELCELRADLLRLRFQAMECFLAGVRPAGNEDDVIAVSESGQKWEKWSTQATDRFEELTQVARWKALVSKTCSYRKTVAAEGEKEKEIPGIKLFNVTEEGEIDIGGVLIAEGWALPAAATPRASPRASPARPAPPPPFGDLGSSLVLGMLSDRNERSASLPKDHERNEHSPNKVNGNSTDHDQKMPSSRSLAGLESPEKERPKSPKNVAELSYPETSHTQPHLNGSHENFLHAERLHDMDKASTETLTSLGIPEALKANMNRMDSHHNLEALARTHRN